MWVGLYGLSSSGGRPVSGFNGRQEKMVSTATTTTPQSQVTTSSTGDAPVQARPDPSLTRSDLSSAPTGQIFGSNQTAWKTNTRNILKLIMQTKATQSNLTNANIWGCLTEISPRGIYRPTVYTTFGNNRLNHLLNALPTTPDNAVVCATPSEKITLQTTEKQRKPNLPLTAAELSTNDTLQSRLPVQRLAKLAPTLATKNLVQPQVDLGLSHRARSYCAGQNIPERR